MSEPAEGVGARDGLRATAVLHVGVKGGGNPETASLATVLRAILTEIADAAREITAEANDLFIAEPPLLRLISPLESDSERIAAREALVAGFKLQVPLTDAPSFAAGTLADERSRGDFENLLAAAEVTVTLKRESGTSAGLEQALLGVVLDQSDILCVVEGTGNEDARILVREARSRNIAVVVIDAKLPHDVRIVGADDAGAWRDGLRTIIAGILDPFKMATPSEQAEFRRVPHRYFSERSQSIPWYSYLNTMFERAVLIGWRGPARRAEQTDGGAGADAPVPSAAFEQAFSRADMLAIRYAHLYRSAYVMRYLLIAPMAVGLIMGFFALTPVVRTLGFGIQWLSVVGTLALTQINKRTDWHERFTTYRFLAELLRHQLYLGRFGRTLPTTLLPVDQKSATSVWVIWQFRSVVRLEGLRIMGRQPVESAHMALLMRAFLDEQCDFYRRSAARFETIASRTWRSSVGLFWVDFVIITLRGGAIGLMRTLGYSTDPSIGPILDWWEDTLNEFDILLPCLAWIILALGDQGEYSRLADQYAAMAENGESILAELDRTEPSYPALVRIATNAAASLTSEVASWRLLISKREVTYM